MDFNQVVTIAVIIVAANAAIIAATQVFLWVRREVLPDPLPLHDMLRRAGSSAEREPLTGSLDFAQAYGRCLTCKVTAQCRDWVQTGKPDGFAAFCPNADYVARVASGHRSA
jgi:hypothetical protein